MALTKTPIRSIDHEIDIFDINIHLSFSFYRTDFDERDIYISCIRAKIDDLRFNFKEKAIQRTDSQKKS